ncbi:LOW QUALITY PROTEIN: hypothetical protein PHMEG_0005748 [Phytophthora megakarya]|uniref:Ubiquitin-like protease family profile domain-containing protein n=1 Tax=Phytophthora megakarya TaxID=4795 RepID=A0A225WQE3_9STRA|nr:LOW QUALITY PROTEIN: hypothetical protein PHMEG_0005748 [Phytophthora megakarya]
MDRNKSNLLTVYEILQNIPTYKSCGEKLLQFYEYLFGSKPKAPIAHELSKLPRTKPLMEPEKNVRIFPKDLVKKCTAKVTAYQAKHRGVPEMQIVLEIPGVGVFPNTTIALMRRWQDAKVAATRIQRAYVNASFYVAEDPIIPEIVENLPMLSYENTELLDLTAKSTISAQTMETVLTKLFHSDKDVRVITIARVKNGSISTDQGHFRRGLAGATNKMKVLIPVNCSNNHWCAVLMNLQKGRSYIYDPMASSYLAAVRAVAQTLTRMVPEEARPSTRLINHVLGLRIQTDSYYCGVYVLLAFEMFCGSEPLGNLSKTTLQYLRYRYLCMCLKN